MKRTLSVILSVLFLLTALPLGALASGFNDSTIDWSNCAHNYDNVYDPDCNVCGAIREVPDIYSGDANNDGKTNIRDLGLLQQYLNGWAVSVNFTVADVNADGKVNVRDLGFLQQWMNNWEVTLKPTNPPEEEMIGSRGDGIIDPNATTIYATVDRSIVCNGQEITLTLSIVNNPGLVGWNVGAAFDESIFELTSLTAGNVFPASGMCYGPVDSSYRGTSSQGTAFATFADFVNPEVIGDGTLYTATLRVKADAPAGTYDILLGTRNNDPDNFSTQDYQSVPVIFEGVSITIGHTYDNECDETCDACGEMRDVGGHISDAAYVCQWGQCIYCGVYVNPVADHIYDNACDADCNLCGEMRDVGHTYSDAFDVVCDACGEIGNYLPGDANNDGRMNIRDLGLIERYIQRYDVALNTLAADVNCDGKVNIRDLGLLQQYLNGWDVELG